MRRFPLLFAPLALILAVNLAACGNKGPLVRPPVEDADVEADLEADTAPAEGAVDPAVQPVPPIVDPVDGSDGDVDPVIETDAVDDADAGQEGEGDPEPVPAADDGNG
jgi:predicted small lipoprotein YifL